MRVRLVLADFEVASEWNATKLRRLSLRNRQDLWLHISNQYSIIPIRLVSDDASLRGSIGWNCALIPCTGAAG